MLTQKREQELSFTENNTDKLFDIFEHADRTLGDGYASEVYMVKEKNKEDGQLYAAKWIKPHAFWTIENEKSCLGIINHPQIVSLKYVFDRRKQPKEPKSKDKKQSEEDKRMVYFVYECCEGGSLGQKLEKWRESGHEMTKFQFYTWAIDMTKCVRYLHEEKKIMHTDLHINNWFLRNNNQIVLGDFGCAQNMDSFYNEDIPQGKNVYYYDGHSAPEMQFEDGKTCQPFSYNGDTWQLACAFTCMMNSSWNFTVPKDANKDYKNLIEFMKEKDPSQRPGMAEVQTYLEELLEKHMKTLPKSTIPCTDDLFKKNEQNSIRIKQVWQKFDQVFTENQTQEEQEVHNPMKENIIEKVSKFYIRSDGINLNKLKPKKGKGKKGKKGSKPLENQKEEKSYGLFIGQVNEERRPHGRGVIMAQDGSYLYEGLFKDGKKHGPGRLIKLSFASPYIKVEKMKYSDGEPTEKLSSEKIQWPVMDSNILKEFFPMESEEKENMIQITQKKCSLQAKTEENPLKIIAQQSY